MLHFQILAAFYDIDTFNISVANMTRYDTLPIFEDLPLSFKLFFNSKQIIYGFCRCLNSKSSYRELWYLINRKGDIDIWFSGDNSETLTSKRYIDDPFHFYVDYFFKEQFNESSYWRGDLSCNIAPEFINSIQYKLDGFTRTVLVVCYHLTLLFKRFGQFN